jgi:membrane protein implicated in regulation of membrane protease activity
MPRLLLLFTGATLIVVAGVVGLATGMWWVLAVVLALHFVAFVVVMTPVMRSLEGGDKPDPVTEARIEEEEERGAP